MDPITSLICLISTIILGGYLLVKWNYSYWKRNGVYQLEPEFPFGNMKDCFILRKEYLGDTLQKFYNHFKSKGLKAGGYYQLLGPRFMPLDLELVKNILQKDFGHFVNHGLSSNKEIDPLTGHLLNLENEEWRQLRVKLTPTFTSAKMKMMFETFVACAAGLGDIFNNSATNDEPLDVKDVVSRFSTDIIGSCAFGLDCNSLKDPESEFRQFGRKITDTPTTIASRLRRLALVGVSDVISNFLSFFKIKRISPEIETFFMKVVRDTVNYRDRKNVSRKDFLQLLMQLRNKDKVNEGADKEGLTMNELTAQCFVFFIAGFETSATTMTFALLELARNQDIQNTLRNEIESVLEKHNGIVSYDAVMEMSYLDNVIHETLRKHPPVEVVTRICVKDYNIPGMDLTLKTGNRIQVSIAGIHHDPDYYPDPEKFDPERFTEENKSKRPPFSFLAFGEGPRICIGARFGLLQSKVGLLTIIRNYKVALNAKTPLPIKYQPGSIFCTVDGGVWLDVVPTKKQQ